MRAKEGGRGGGVEWGRVLEFRSLAVTKKSSLGYYIVCIKSSFTALKSYLDSSLING